MTHNSSPHVAVIGGGCAGLAAAARLLEAGISSTLFEASPVLGGRARGMYWHGLQLDNGQHILLGAYSETLALLRLADVDMDRALLRLPLQLIMHNQFALQASRRLPAPLHILLALLRAKGLSWPERLSILRFMGWLRRIHYRLPADEPLQNLLARKSQPARVIQLLWEPLCLAALNTPLHTASAQVFLNVLHDSFTQTRVASDMLLPRSDLSALLAEPLASYIRRKGGAIKANTPVAAVYQANDGFLLQTQDGQRENFSHVIMAVSPFRLPGLLADLPALAPTAALCRQFEYQPIYTVYLQYAATSRLPIPMLGLTGAAYSQWLFDRGQLCGQHGLIAVIISAEGRHQQLTQQKLAVAVAQEVALAFPAFDATPLWHKVIAEKRATFACTHNLVRPGMLTALPRLYLAGDYTAGDYPATIEAAARSGANCARQILAELATP